jgi:hypothetical protein
MKSPKARFEGCRMKANVRRSSPVFAAWLAIQSRGPVCRRWRSFSNFYRDVGPPPSWRHLLIRTDTSGEFSPRNAGWRVGPSYRRRSTAR